MKDDVSPASVRLKLPRQRAAALFEACFQIAPHQAKPVCVSRHLVFCVHRRNRILKVDNRRKGCFQNDIGNVCRIRLADWMGRIDHQFDVQAIVPEKPAARFTRYQLRRVGQMRRLALPVCPNASGERHGIIEECLGASDDSVTPLRIIAARLGRRSIERVGAIQGIIEASPASIRGIQHESVIERWHNELRSGHCRNLGIHIGCPDCEGRRLGNQIADFAQEGLIGGHVCNWAGIGAVPVVDFCLKCIPFREQSTIHRNKSTKDCCEAGPNRFSRNPGPCNRRTFDEFGKLVRNLQAGTIDVNRHEKPLRIFR